ncbi:hypothetical protein EX895_004080 [Sporisorium graminicola]|uniref:Fluoride ion transporter CrcB n=1 Tax=Sporisorium graminicola TaxID=280036 RepID=A0A4U7KSL8_9BASI|nr:hypothetical protein EX895_004080 [Sporisorium graminicola]TKY87403.1 hypothetical protein EX895_004080 [Sporisorium graminicola]
MDTHAAAGTSRLPDLATPQTRRSLDRRSAATPTLSHKTSMISATDTFASATDGEGYYTDAAADVSAYHTDDGRSRFESVPHAINAHGLSSDGEGASLSRTSSNRTAQRGDPQAAPLPNTDTIHQQLGALSPTSPTTAAISGSATSTQRDPSNEEAGKQLEPGHQSSTPATHHRALRHCAILGLLSLSAIWGTLAREGLVALNTYDGESVAPLVWAQSVGCLIMGLAIGANRQAIEGRYPPAYIMITTGLCGSITTFSKWMLDVFRAFGNQRHFDRHGLHNVMDALSQTALTIGMALVSVSAGVALSNVLNIDHLMNAVRSRSQRRSSLPSSNVGDKEGGDRKPNSESMVQPGQGHTLVLDTSMFVLGLIFWIASGILCALYAPFRHVTFSLVLAPPGTVLRWYLSRINTWPASKRLSLPLGTLAANLLATAVICAAFTASRAGSVPRSFPGGLTGCEALQGLQDGFCGCLSTISTFAVELRTIRPRRKAVRYAVVSWVAGVLGCVLLIGAPWWSIGMDGRCLGYTE